MSIDIMNRIWWRDFGPVLAPIQDDHPGSEKNFAWTMLSLADSAGDEGFCWPAVETIARKARLSPRAVQMALKQAEVVGILRRRHRRDSSTQYVFVLDKLPHVERPKRAKERGPLEHFEEQEELFLTGAGDSPVDPARVNPVRRTGAGDSLTGAGDAPRTINESSGENHHSLDALFARVERGWNELVEHHPDMARFPPLTDERKSLIARRTDDHAGKKASDEDKEKLWALVFEQIGGSKLLTGQSTDWQGATLDWTLRKANFSKIVGLQYGNGRDAVGTAGRGDRSSVEAGHEALGLVRSHRDRTADGYQPA